MDTSPTELDAVDHVVAAWRRTLPQLDPWPLEVLGRLGRVADQVDRLLRPPFAAAGLASGDFDLLAALRRSPSHTVQPSELAASMLVTQGATTKRVDRLERQGLVSRKQSSSDGRSRPVTLTPAGRVLVERLLAEHLANERRLLSELSHEEQVSLAALLRRLGLALPA